MSEFVLKNRTTVTICVKIFCKQPKGLAVSALALQLFSNVG